jgi:aminoglycoside phosphotransferase (APT) family kinase protein
MPALLVTTFLPGERLELFLPRLADAERASLGRSLGELLADLGGMPTLSTGPFVDGRLTIGSFEPDLDGLPAAVELAEPRLGWWSPDELTGLREVAVDAQALLDTVGRRVLVHSDFNAKNLLVDPDSLEVTGLLDWEYAHAGHPFTDLGNLLRFERDEVFTDAVLAAYTGRRGGSAGDALALARAADLWALVDLAARRGENPVAERADRLLRKVALRRDPAAW